MNLQHENPATCQATVAWDLRAVSAASVRGRGVASVVFDVLQASHHGPELHQLKENRQLRQQQLGRASPPETQLLLKSPPAEHCRVAELEVVDRVRL